MASVVRDLRDLVPLRSLNRAEAMRIAELQASRLLARAELDTPPVPESLIADLPRIQVDRMTPIPVSGSAHWASSRWVIVLNGAEPLVRQRFSLAHEFKHVLDNPFIDFLYPGEPGQSSDERREQVADYFAACLLMPRMWVKRHWCQGSQDLPSLARRFKVSQMAMNVRLQQVGLKQDSRRCDSAPVKSRPGRQVSRSPVSPFLRTSKAHPRVEPAFLECLEDAARKAA